MLDFLDSDPDRFRGPMSEAAVRVREDIRLSGHHETRAWVELNGMLYLIGVVNLRQDMELGRGGHSFMIEGIVMGQERLGAFDPVAEISGSLPVDGVSLAEAWGED